MKISRREFTLSLLAAMSTNFLAKPLWAAAQKKRPKPGKKVLIVGAGMSGLYAADLLLSRGFEVQILESGSRAGGRVLGLSVGDNKFDFGGQAFNADMTRVKALGKRFGLHAITKPEQDSFFLQGDKLISGDEFSSLWEENEALEKKAGPLGSLLQNPTERKRLVSESVWSWAKPQLSEVGADFFRTSFSSEYCEAPENVSLLHFIEVSRTFQSDGDEMKNRFREGMFSIAENLYQIVKKQTELGCAVQKIECSPTGVVAVAGGRRWAADYVLLTLSPPLLRQLSISGIDDSALKAAISSYQGAAVYKMIAVYSENFWKSLPSEGYFLPPLGLSLMDNSDVKKGVYSLLAHLGGPMARKDISQEEVLTKIATVLGPQALHPVSSLMFPWLPDNEFPGGYGPTQKPSTNGGQVLPLHLGRIFLAGSVTSDKFSGYVEGALASAERAVQAIEKQSSKDIRVEKS